jgi:hypothetical protein
LGLKGAGRSNQTTRRVDLLPNIPQQHAAHAAFVQLVDHPFAKELLPIGEGLELGISFAHGFIA